MGLSQRREIREGRGNTEGTELSEDTETGA